MADDVSSLTPVLTAEAWELLNSLPDYEQNDADGLNTSLRKQGWPAETVAAVLTQLRLRRDAKAKFGSFAQRMLLTETGLQQATRIPVAIRHARRFRQAGVEHVADLGCGIGADSLALASAGLQVVAVEADESTSAAATINLMAFPEAQVRHTTAEDFATEHGLLPPSDPPSGWGLWLDPARRNDRSRIWDPEEFSPPLSFVTELTSTGIPLGVKLGPGIPHDLIPADCEAEWVSIDGELVEVVLWFNALARHDAEGRLIRRAATVLTSLPEEEPLEDGATEGILPRIATAELVSAEDFGQGLSAEPVGRSGLEGVLWEPDPAVIRAGLVAELCEQLGGRMLDEHIAYFSTDSEIDTPFARGYRVMEVLDFNVKGLKRWCAEQEVTSVEIKKRGVDVVPEQLRKQLLPKKPRGPKRHLTLVITRLGDDRVAAVVEPLG